MWSPYFFIYYSYRFDRKAERHHVLLFRKYIWKSWRHVHEDDRGRMCCDDDKSCASVIISVGIFDMPVVTGILTSKSHTERRYLNRIKIFGINFQFFVRKHKQNSPSTFVRIHPNNLILYDRKKMFNSVAEGDA